MTRSIDFFEEQFRRQVADREFVLNPFEQLALEHVRGDILDLGCGLGNLTLVAARRGCKVTAVDASPTAIERIRSAAAAEGLQVHAFAADLATWDIVGDFDIIVAIGILMFFTEKRAIELLGQVREHVRAGGLAIVNVLVEGTTYLDMFEPGHFHLFGRDEVLHHFRGWRHLAWRAEGFAAPKGQVKSFTTIVAEKPAGMESDAHGGIRS